MKIKLFLCGGEHPKSEYSLGLGYLYSYCNHVDIEIVREAADLKDCDLIGLSSNDHGVREAYSILQGTKIPIVIGGQCTLWNGIDKLGFKYVVRGEGELAFQSIIDGKFNPDAGQIEDIDTIPFPVRGRCGKYIPILSARGCPYNCYFCSSSVFWKKVRFHSAEYFIEEIDCVDTLYPQATVIYIMDDLFVFNKDRLRKIHQMWMSKNYHKRFSLLGFIRSSNFDKEICIMMKEMGFSRLRFGAESGSDRMLKILNKRATVADHQRTIDICNEVGIRVGASFMNKLPGETEDDRILTQKFIHKNKNKLSIQGNYTFKPFAGTKFYNGEDLLKANMKVRGKV